MYVNIIYLPMKIINCPIIIVNFLPKTSATTPPPIMVIMDDICIKETDSKDF